MFCVSAPDLIVLRRNSICSHQRSSISLLGVDANLRGSNGGAVYAIALHEALLVGTSDALRYILSHAICAYSQVSRSPDAGFRNERISKSKVVRLALDMQTAAANIELVHCISEFGAIKFRLLYYRNLGF